MLAIGEEDGERERVSMRHLSLFLPSEGVHILLYFTRGEITTDL